MSLVQRMLIEPMAVTVHALERAKTTGLLNFASTVVVQGCGPIGLMMIATLFANGIGNIVAIDGVEQRLEFAPQDGRGAHAERLTLGGAPAVLEEVRALTKGRGADFAFQCTGVPAAAAAIWKMVRRGGGLCEVASSWTTASARSIRTRTSAKRKSPPSARGFTPRRSIPSPSR